MTLFSVSIVVLNWNQEEVTIDCLHSLRKVKEVPIHVILVDNGSTADSVDRMMREFPEVEFIRLSENLGFAGGNNVGIKRALRDKASHIMLLNNDTLVEPNFLQPLLHGLSSLDTTVVGPKIRCHPEVSRLWFAGGKMDWQTGTQKSLGANEIDKGQWNQPCEVDYLAGCCFLAPAQVFQEIGGLDERYFIYFEEIDWNLRAAKCGYRRHYIPESVIYHKVSQAMGAHSANSDYYVSRNRLLFLWTHAPRRRRYVLLPLMTARTLRYASKLSREGRSENALAIRQGVRDFFRGRFGKRQMRNIVDRTSFNGVDGHGKCSSS